VVSVYGRVNAGVRARAVSWLRRAGVSGHLTSYFGRNEAGASQFLRDPAQAVTSERRLVALARARPATLFLSREASPLSKGSIEERLLRSAAHGVYDIDDALHAVSRGRLFEAMFSKAAKATSAARAADVVIAGNEYLAEWASQWNTDVRLIPTCVEPRDYRRKENYEVGEVPRIVWMGTPSGEPYMLDIAPALLEIHRQLGATLTVIGAGDRDLGPLEAIVERVPWSLDLVHRRLADFDLGLMPLRNTAYEQGKCAYKLLEYGAAGVPFVGSPVGVNASILEASGAPGPRTVAEWVEALHACLTMSADERRRQASGQLRVIEDSYSFDRWTAAWSAAVLA
jgi:glycosyltransferase involved in cell wall biosynthesis